MINSLVYLILSDSFHISQIKKKIVRERSATSELYEK